MSGTSSRHAVGMLHKDCRNVGRYPRSMGIQAMVESVRVCDGPFQCFEDLDMLRSLDEHDTLSGLHEAPLV